MGSNQRHRKRVSSLALAALLLCEILGKCKTKMKGHKGLDKRSFFSKAIQRFAYLRSLHFGNLFLFFWREGRSVFGN